MLLLLKIVIAYQINIERIDVIFLEAKFLIDDLKFMKQQLGFGLQSSDTFLVRFFFFREYPVMDTSQFFVELKQKFPAATRRTVNSLKVAEVVKSFAKTTPLQK